MRFFKFKIGVICIILLFMNSCASYNRMTSPVVLQKGEKILTTALVIDPFSSIEPQSIYSFQPVVGYRTGLGKKSEIGIALYGPFYPSLVFDYKHGFISKEHFHFSGDFSLFGGYYRTTGVDYSLLFGNQKIYGVFGAWYPIAFTEKSVPYLKYGIGCESANKSGFGLELNVTHITDKSVSNGFGWYDYSWFASLGIKYDFRFKKYKITDPKEQYFQK